MTRKRIIQSLVDAAMTLLLPLLMAYELVGADTHEWAGVAMFLLFLLHHALNWKWHKNLFKGRYTAIRTVGTTVNALIFLLMLSLTVSGMVMSRHVFFFLDFGGGASLARTVHLIASYWCYILTSIHLGLHGRMLMGILRKAFRIDNPAKTRGVILKVVAALLFAYGIYAFLKRGLTDYMLLRSEFVFFDFSEPLVFFFVDYLAIMALFALAGYYIATGLARIKKTQCQMRLRSDRQ